MESPGSAYLFALAQIAITFAGFTALFMMLRQAIGARSEKYDLFATRNYLFLSFLVVLGSLLPPLLTAFSLGSTTVFRVASLIVALPLLGFVFWHPWRRRQITGARFPWSIYPQQGIFCCVVAILLSNAMGVFGEPGLGRFELGVTLIQADLFYAIILTLNMVFGAQPLGRADGD